MRQLAVQPAQLCLRLPMTVRHVIDAASPLAAWRQGPSGIGADASSEIVVVVRAPLEPCRVVRTLGVGPEPVAVSGQLPPAHAAA